MAAPRALLLLGLLLRGASGTGLREVARGAPTDFQARNGTAPGFPRPFASDGSGSRRERIERAAAAGTLPRPRAPLLPESGRSERSERIKTSLSRLEEVLKEHQAAVEDNAKMLAEFGIGPSRTAPELKSGADAAVSGSQSFIEQRATMPGGALGGAVAGGLMSMLFSRTTLCVMCSYILEMADRQVKAIPRWANGGGGNFPGTMDFSPGENQGYFRTYPGSYLELESGSGTTAGTAAGSGTRARAATAYGPGTGLPEAPLPAQAVPAGSPPAFAASGPRTIAQAIGDSGLLSDASRQANEAAVAASAGLTQQGADARIRRVRRGRMTHRDVDRMDALSEKAMEYQQMFKDMMDALDSTCFNDMPSGYTSYCQMPFKNGEALVELYLHDYEDWEICTEINCCTGTFYLDDF
jgi:hypothetical protein